MSQEISPIRLRAADVDGTLTENKQIPQAVLEGYQALVAQGVTTTVISGKGLPRIKEVLGIGLPLIVNPSTTPIGAETGARIVRPDADRTGKNLVYYPLAIEDIIATLHLADQGAMEFIAYCPEDPRERSVMWTPNASEEYALKLQQKFGYFADIFTSATVSLSELERKMRVEKPCMLAVKATDNAQIQTALPDGLNAVFNEGFLNVLPQDVNKAVGLMHIADILGIPLGETGFMGNDLNDYEALTLDGIGETVVVGEYGDLLVAKLDHTPDNLVRVATPTELGHYLQANLTRRGSR
jgi:hydroxymethylpyrimidine pyrophosphatase-like HAD family hydrolase